MNDFAFFVFSAFFVVQSLRFGDSDLK